MISRKERRIQKALGTEDSMPPTLHYRMKCWWENVIIIRMYKYSNSIDAFNERMPW